MAIFAHLRADALHSKAMALEDAEDNDGALALYEKALVLDPERATTLYNVGLIHKYRRAWPESFDANRRAYALRPDDEAVRWNLGIAATALGDWATAREVWTLCGYDIGEGKGPIVASFGSTPVRLNPDDSAEVVWAQRVDPVRAVISNIPFPGSGYFHGDTVLHDGAATGYRTRDGVDWPVFNVFERLERSAFRTATAQIVAPSRMDLDALEQGCDVAGLICENWTETTRYLCKQCSEGIPHEAHDQDLPDPVWCAEHDFGFAASDPGRLDEVLRDWSARPCCAVRDLQWTP